MRDRPSRREPALETSRAAPRLLHDRQEPFGRSCDVDQTKEAEAPDVDVSASGGQLPAYDVDTKEVEVGTTERNVAVPDVDVNTEETTVETPTLEVKE